jgi:hypothetical protein
MDDPLTDVPTHTGHPVESLDIPTHTGHPVEPLDVPTHTGHPVEPLDVPTHTGHTDTPLVDDGIVVRSPTVGDWVVLGVLTLVVVALVLLPVDGPFGDAASGSAWLAQTVRMGLRFSLP